MVRLPGCRIPRPTAFVRRPRFPARLREPPRGASRVLSHDGFNHGKSSDGWTTGALAVATFVPRCSGTRVGRLGAYHPVDQTLVPGGLRRPPTEDDASPRDVR